MVKACNSKNVNQTNDKGIKHFVFILILIPQFAQSQVLTDIFGALIKSDTSKNEIYLCFTGHDYDEGFSHVSSVLDTYKIKASFFLTGDFIRSHKNLTLDLFQKEHYVGPHSDKHLLYCDWNKRDSLLHSPEHIANDIKDNLKELELLGIKSSYFMPPYEWYNSEVVQIAKKIGLTTVNFSPGSRSNADYTTPDMSNYLTNAELLASIYKEEEENGFKGFHLLIHPGTSPKRSEKLYLELENIIKRFKKKGYSFSTFERH